MRLISSLLFLSGILLHTTVLGAHPPCTAETASVRREWGSLRLHERRSYINAVLCMQRLPSLYNLPGTKSRFDDFGALHISSARSIHYSGIFFAWHRHFITLWESTLRRECAYRGAQPYWNWPLHLNLTTSPLFDGSDTSLSGNGVFLPNRDPYNVGGTATVPIGTGGGCVTSGPFVNMTVNMGPFTFDQAFTALPANWSALTSHCLIRDLNDWGINQFNNQSQVDRVLAAPEIGLMQSVMDGAGALLGPHGGGHYAIGYGLFDFFASPLDPAFFLHHGMIDRVWTLWQASDPAVRRFQYNGTSTIFNADDTPPVTNDTVLDFGLLGESKTMAEVADPMSGIYCYRYE